MKSLVKGDVKMVSVVKANAYGHGQNEVVDILDGVTDYFQVDDFRELEILRKITKKKILVLGYVAKDEMKKALEHEGILGVYDEKQILALDSISKELGRKAIVHVKIDAYLGRQGVMPEKVEEMVNCLKFCKH